MAGQLTLGQIQINDNPTAANNFVIIPDNAGGLKLSRGNVGATTQDLLLVDSAGNVTGPLLNITNATNLTGTVASGVTGTTQALGTSNTTIATTAFANPGTSIAANGYTKLPSGIIIQWGTFDATTTYTTVSYPIAFPSGTLNVVTVPYGNGGSAIAGYPVSWAASTFYYFTSGASYVTWHAIGY